MPDSVFTFRMPAGIQGECSRFNVIGTTIKPENQNLTTPFTGYGQVGTIDANGARPILATDTAAPPVVGISVRPFPATDNTVANPGVVPFGASTPMARGIIDVMYRGYITMKLNGATAAVKGGAVFVWYGATGGGHVLAGIEAVVTAGSSWQLAGAYFSGPADANGNVEIAFRI